MGRWWRQEDLILGYLRCRVNMEEAPCEYSSTQQQGEACLQQCPWLVDCEARAERHLGVLPIGMSIDSSFAAVLRSYVSV